MLFGKTLTYAALLGGALLLPQGTAQAVDRAALACARIKDPHDVLWIRTSPSTEGYRVGAIPHNACGIIVNWHQCVRIKKRSWCQVSYEGVKGWSFAQYLKKDS